MDHLLLAINDWRFACCLLFLGSLLGPFIFRITPAPSDFGRHMDRMQRANLAGEIATRAGITEVKDQAFLATVQSGFSAISSLQRQKHQMIVIGLLLAAGISSVLFLYSSIRAVPGWIFLAAGVWGVVKVWRSW